MVKIPKPRIVCTTSKAVKKMPLLSVRFWCTTHRHHLSFGTRSHRLHFSTIIIISQNRQYKTTFFFFLSNFLYLRKISICQMSIKTSSLITLSLVSQYYAFLWRFKCLKLKVAERMLYHFPTIIQLRYFQVLQLNLLQ